MTSAAGPDRYDAVARAMHWATALAILVAFVMGLTIDLLPRESRPPYLNVHALLGVAVIGLALARIVWRIGHPAPAIASGSSGLLALAIRAGHAALYVTMLVAPAIGFAALFARGRSLNFGLFEILSPIPRTQEWIKPATELHEKLAFLLIALAIGHVLAALYHHFVTKDGLLLRMMPPRKG